MRGDTIAAISTPLGEGGIGIVRLSGPRAVEIAGGLFQATSALSLQHVPSHTLHHGFIVAAGRRVDEVLVSVMRAPRTYTREDTVEINGHGGIVALTRILDLVLAGGARLAERGEFTERAFMNGRISLDEAQAVLDVVRARTRLGLEAAVERLGGRFSAAIAAIREEIGRLLASLEVGMDFPDVDEATEDLGPPLARLVEEADALLARGERGRIVRDGLTVAIVGRTNVGKSTLLNAFLAEERAIVTPLPGTTRDTIEEEAAIGGVPVCLIDTAGIREPAGLVEAEAQRRARRAIDRADLLLLVFGRSLPLTADDLDLARENWERPTVAVLNKSDLPQRAESLDPGRFAAVREVSAKTGDGVDALGQEILRLVLRGEIPTHDAILLLDVWERDLLRRARSSLGEARADLVSGVSPDLVAEALRSAYVATGQLQGIDVGEDVLKRIFSRFCVGK